MFLNNTVFSRILLKAVIEVKSVLCTYQKFVAGPRPSDCKVNEIVFNLQSSKLGEAPHCCR